MRIAAFMSAMDIGGVGIGSAMAVSAGHHEHHHCWTGKKNKGQQYRRGGRAQGDRTDCHDDKGRPVPANVWSFHRASSLIAFRSGPRQPEPRETRNPFVGASRIRLPVNDSERRRQTALPASHCDHGTLQSPFCQSSSGAPPVSRTSTMSPGWENS